MFMATHLIGFGATAGVDASIVKTDNEAQVGAATVFTYTGKSIGTARTGRRIVLCVHMVQAAAPSISSVTIGGVAATSVVNVTNGSNSRAAIFILQVDTGTTANIVVTFSGTVGRCGVTVYAAYDLQSSTATGTNSSNANPMTATLNISAGGVAVGCCADYAGSVPTHTWTNLTKDVDATLDAAAFIAYSAASANFASPQTLLSITATPSTAPTEQIMVVASFR